MADGHQKSGSYHPKINCQRIDVTSNLKQRKHGKVISKQSKGLMSSRSFYSTNFSAWIECFKNFDDEAATAIASSDDAGLGQAQVEAEEMQAKIKQIEKDRNERLQLFQQEVSERVKRARRLKQQEQLCKSLEKIEKESKVIYQSAFPKRIPTMRKDSCSFRSSISVDKIKNIMTGEANVDSSHNIANVMKSVNEIDHKTQMVKSQSNQARASLVSKIVDTDMTNLPGGVWGHPRPQVHQEKRMELEGDQEQDVLDRIFISRSRENERQPGQMLNDMWKDFNPDIENMKGKADIDQVQECVNADKIFQKGKDRRRIRFQLPEKEIVSEEKLEEESKVSKETNNPCSRFPVADVNGDKENKKQYWTYRKLFMDIEREKVREMQRRRNHKKIITRLKQEKETERFKAEKEVEVFIPSIVSEPASRNPKKADVDGESNTQKFKQRLDFEKGKEAARYIDALKNLIKQRVYGEDNRLPAMCSCGDTILSTHPDTCANNCIFYKNPKEFARVLSSVLATLDS